MSLALVQVSVPVFQEIRDHLVSHMPDHRNMHMREWCTRNGERRLRYLHAMYAPESTSDVQGMICGPEVSLSYRMRMASRTRVHLDVVPRRITPPKEDARLFDRFLPEIQGRIADERERPEHHPKLTPGQFYLRRRVPGVHRTHRNCIAAVAAGVLDRDFVSQLYAWNLRLIRGRAR